MRLRLFEGESRQKPVELAASDRHRPGLVFLGPPESTSFQPSIVEPEAVVIPVKNLELVAASIAEDKPTLGEDIELECDTHDSGQAVDGLAHVRRPTRQIHSAAVDGAQQVATTTRSTSESSAGSKPDRTSIVATPTRTLTCDWVGEIDSWALNAVALASSTISNRAQVEVSGSECSGAGDAWPILPSQ
jgi:hypothetical protein